MHSRTFGPPVGRGPEVGSYTVTSTLLGQPVVRARVQLSTVLFGPAVLLLGVRPRAVCVLPRDAVTTLTCTPLSPAIPVLRPCLTGRTGVFTKRVCTKSPVTAASIWKSPRGAPVETE